MLSILIPTFNTNIFELVKELYSQINSSNIPFEIIVYDDASTIDQSENSKITNYTNCNYLINNTNLGRTATRNKLAKTAIYNWLLFLDADVYPTSKEFIKNYIASIKNIKTTDCIYGGITYKKEQPKQNEILRWIYGKEKEFKSSIERKKNPHFIISQNLCIRKELFLELNIFTQNQYGLDNIFSYQLKRKKANVLHIDNEVFHLGLESNDVFLKKSIDSLKTTIAHEKQGNIPNDLRPVQRIYNKLTTFLNSHKLIVFIVGKFEKRIEKNLTSKKPSILLFDVYRLYHYIKLKSDA